MQTGNLPVTLPVSIPVVASRAETLKYYSVDDRGLIDCPCSFTGEPIWVPFFWTMAKDGIGDTRTAVKNGVGVTISSITIEDDDVEQFPELSTYTNVEVYCDAIGNIHGEAVVSFEKFESDRKQHDKSFPNDAFMKAVNDYLDNINKYKQRYTIPSPSPQKFWVDDVIDFPWDVNKYKPRY